MKVTDDICRELLAPARRQEGGRVDQQEEDAVYWPVCRVNRRVGEYSAQQLGQHPERVPLIADGAAEGSMKPRGGP